MTDDELIAYLKLQGLDKDVAAANRIEELEKELNISRMASVVMDNTVEELESKLALMIFERDEAWKRAAYSEKMWGEAEVKLAKVVEALMQLQLIVGDILGAHMQDNESRDEALALIKNTLTKLEGNE